MPLLALSEHAWKARRMISGEHAAEVHFPKLPVACPRSNDGYGPTQRMGRLTGTVLVWTACSRYRRPNLQEKRAKLVFHVFQATYSVADAAHRKAVRRRRYHTDPDRVPDNPSTGAACGRRKISLSSIRLNRCQSEASPLDSRRVLSVPGGW